MNRTEYMKAVYETDLDSTSKTILVYLGGYRKNWKEDGRVWVSAQTISKDTSLSERSVKDRIPRLRDAGWLIDTGERRPNGKGRPSVVYDLGVGGALKVADISAAVAPKVENLSASPAPKVEDFSANDEALKCKNEGTLVQNQQDFSAPVAHEQEKNKIYNKIEEQEPTTPTVADAPVVVDSSLIQEDKEDQYLQALLTMRSMKANKETHVWERTRELVLNPENMEYQSTDPLTRVSLAYDQTLREIQARKANQRYLAGRRTA